MANREELSIIRAARAGEAEAQLTLGKRYLFGSTSLPRSLPTALYWLDRAAQQDQRDAWMLIGSHVPYETVQQATQPSKLFVWYERAFDAGVAQAGLVLAKLVLGQPQGAVGEAMRNKALRALQVAAHAGIAEAQWMLAQIMEQQHADTATSWPVAHGSTQGADNEAMLAWATRAARSGVVDAQYALADHAWAHEDRDEFLRWALPLGRHLIEQGKAAENAAARDIELAGRCAHALIAKGELASAELAPLLEFAARGGHRDAQLSMGLWFAHMDIRGNRVGGMPGVANYKKAIRWLSQAAEQGLAEAWYALFKIYLKPECSQRSLRDAYRCLERAGRAGYGRAQLELGIAAWRARHEQEGNDVRAVEWLQNARAQNVAEAGPLLARIAAPAAPATWALDALRHLSREAAAAHPLLAARLELAAVFGLSRSEALLIDPKAADCGHCLVVDVRTLHPHGKRHLILIQNPAERRTLDRVIGVFGSVDCGPGGPEGNYRQRLYKLKTLTSR